MNKQWLGVLCLSLLLLILPGCAAQSELPFISLKPDSAQVLAENGEQEPEMLRLAVASLASPRFTVLYYSPLTEYLEHRLNLPIQLVLRNSYTEVVDLLTSGTVHLAHISTYCLLQLEEVHGTELFVAPVIADGAACSSYIIVHKDSGTLTFEGLRGESFAFTDPLSTLGTLYPVYLLTAIDETPDSYFASYTYTYGSDNSIRAVAGRLVEGAAVNSLAYDFLARHSPELVDDITVVHKSRSFSPNPVVASKSLDPDLKERLLAVLLAMHENEQGRNILAGMQIKQFIPHLQAAYDEIRAMAAAVGKVP